MTTVREIVNDIESSSSKALNQADPKAQEHLYKILGELSTNRTLLNDVGTVLMDDCDKHSAMYGMVWQTKGAPVDGFPVINVDYSAETDGAKHVVDIQFSQKAGVPGLQWTAPGAEKDALTATSLRKTADDIENLSIKALNQEPKAKEHLLGLLGDLSTDRMRMNDIGSLLMQDTEKHRLLYGMSQTKGDPKDGFPIINVIYSPDTDGARHVVDIQFNKYSDKVPQLEWTEAINP